MRDIFPKRKVVREVQGVTMVLPWSHRLPDYAADGSTYGQNLVALARALAADGKPLKVLDVGANVGDSALQILNATDARVLCVEADAAYLEFLRINTRRDSRVTIEPSLLVPHVPAAGQVRMAPVRTGGTTRFEHDAAGVAVPAVSVEDLRQRSPEFRDLRLVKSDTDGYDVALIPAIAEVWRDSQPVLFFEYDHALSRAAGHDPLRVWDRLAELGYSTVGVWDNGGRPLGRGPLDDIVPLTAALDVPINRRAQHYWDVAVVHSDDVLGEAALRELIPSDLQKLAEGVPRRPS